MLGRKKIKRNIKIIILLILIIVFLGPKIWDSLKNFNLFSGGNGSIEVISNVTGEDNNVEPEENKETVIEIDGKEILLNDEEISNTEQLIEKLKELKPKDKKVILHSKMAKQLTFSEVKSVLEENDYIIIIED